MRAHRANLRHLGADVYMAAVAAFPNNYAIPLEHLAVFNVIYQLIVAFFVFLLYLADRLE